MFPVRLLLMLPWIACRRGIVGWILVGAIISTVGCNRGPAPVKIPYVDPVAASQGAVELYDTDGDGQLSQKELAACPGILSKLSIYDTDGNKSLTQEEIETRLRDFFPRTVGMTGLSVGVYLDGRPLPEATVKLIPEKYLGDEVKPAWGYTSSRGIAPMDIRVEDKPETERDLHGVHYGTYRVEITHPTIKIPAKYNTATTLGYETERGNPSVSYNLKSR